MNRKESRKVSLASSFSSSSSREPFPKSLVEDFPDSLTNTANGNRINQYQHQYKRNDSTSSGNVDPYNQRQYSSSFQSQQQQQQNNTLDSTPTTKRKLSLFGRKLLPNSSNSKDSTPYSSTSSFSRNNNVNNNRPSIEDSGPPNSRNYSTVSGNNNNINQNQPFMSNFDHRKGSTSTSSGGPLSQSSPMSSPPRSDGLLDLEPNSSRNLVMGEGWDGWGAKMTVPNGVRDMPTSPGTAAIAPWEYPEEATPVATPLMPTYSRTPSNKGTIRPTGEGSSIKKKSTFMSLLKRKTSRSDGKDEPIGIVPLPDTGYDKLTLPAKLQARGDATEHISLQANKSSNKTSKKPKRPYLPTSTSSRDVRPPTTLLPPIKTTGFKGDPGISLDTDLDSMEGIVNLSAISSSAQMSPEALARNRSLSGGSSVELDRIYAGEHHRPSISESLSRSQNGNTQGLGIDSVVRRGSFAPYYASPADSPASYRSTGGGTSPSSPTSPPLLGSLNTQSAGGQSFWSTNLNSSTSNQIQLRDQPISPLTTLPRSLPSSPNNLNSNPSLLRVDSAFGHTSSSSFPSKLSSSNTNNNNNIPTISENASSSRTIMMNNSMNSGAGAAWTAPDSWAVKGDAGALEADSSEEEEESEEEEDLGEGDGGETEEELLEGTSGTSPSRLGAGIGGTMPGGGGGGGVGIVSGKLGNGIGGNLNGVNGNGNGMLGVNGHHSTNHGPNSSNNLHANNLNGHALGDAETLARLGTSSGRTVLLKNGRPGTSGSRLGSSAGRFGANSGRLGSTAGRPGTAEGIVRLSQKSFMVRVFRPDSTFSTLPVPITVTASELTATMSRKYQVNVKSGHALYLREKGLERRMGANERPVLLQKRRFEQAGYTELDKLEDLGREDNSYLCKLVYKATHASLSAPEEDIGGTLEFVDLSARGVETIPIFLYRHAHEIVSLNLSKNRPFDLPTDFVQLCTAMRELVISHMGIKRIPQAVKECFGLTRLDISNNNIVDLEHIALDELSELTSLKCHNNRLYTLPEYFTNFQSLKYVNLSNNRFDVVPPVVCRILCLVEIDISFNTISVLPTEIGDLQYLERLVVLANTITSLPASLGTLAFLKEFDCRRNLITDLSVISGVDKLEVLRCEYNQNSVLDSNWRHMRILTASNNSLTRFALAGTGSTLTSLNLSFAKLSSLALDMFDHLGGVENLVFDSNQIRVLPEGIGSLANLVHLSIKNNILDELPVTIGKLQRLQSLQISGNNISSLPAQIWLCSQLVTLNATSNLMKDFPDPPLSGSSPEGDEARKMSAISAKAPSTASGRMAPPLAFSLQKLYLGDNRIGDDVFAPISLMTELRVLNLSFNEIYEIPNSSLFKCQHLEELYLSGNKLTSLPPDDLERLVNLKLIYLNGNKLQTLPAELGKIKKLFALDVGNNVLKYNIANWPYDWNWNWNLELRYLNLSGNKRLEIKPGHSSEPPGPRTAKRRNLADFSALTKLHVLGLMDITLMIPSLPDESEDRRVRTSLSEINDMGYGIADTLGSRCDTLSLVDIVVPRFRSKDDEAIFGLFDAVNKGSESGARIVRYLQYHFAAVLTLELSRLKSGEVTSDAIRRAFLGINRDYGNSLLPGDIRRKNSESSISDGNANERATGAAGIIVYIRKKRMYVANAGNALAVISARGGSARLISKKHDPFEGGEVARIRAAEGWISHRGFVNEEVDVSRAFGFFNVFPAINCSPNIQEIDLADTDEFVIIANRGLWEHMSYQAAVDVARTERSDPMTAASKLRDLAISYGSPSNIMVMVLAVGDLFKAKKDYRMLRGVAMNGEEDGYYGAQKSGAMMRRGKEEGAGERYLNLLDREVPPPVGLVALVFTDIRNSTALWESNPGMQTAIRMHNQLLRRQLRAIGGYEVKTEGDAFMVSFPTVTSALLWCLTCQVELLREDWPQEILDSEEGKEILNEHGEVMYRGLSVRMGMHWGAPVCEADPITRRMDYFGPMVNRASRISAVAEGGQISASQDVVHIIEDIVMERKAGPASLDSDNEDEDEVDAEDKIDVVKVDGWVDPAILALRRLGFGISELGERRLKGMETPETLSLIWPKSLKDRLVGKAVQSEQTEVWVSTTTQEIDLALVNNLLRVVARLEAATSSLIHGSSTLRTPLTFITLPTAPDASDEDRAVMVEACVSRVENCLATLVLRQLGPYVEVLSALGGALGTNPEYIMTALNRYAALMANVAA